MEIDNKIKTKKNDYQHLYHSITDFSIPASQNAFLLAVEIEGKIKNFKSKLLKARNTPAEEKQMIADVLEKLNNVNNDINEIRKVITDYEFN
ncbi:hypothetical protein [Aquamicrobium sp.]|uniref:hypothetical protein n=1 Tax=Aquamicrobium sp. TaxID=1872579 RepID=UPI002588437A|nr:hypothetical protein [Aquamicrobium sp.]MCK9550942.1 hypothetical protein [Aquamicrobium sp.]